MNKSKKHIKHERYCHRFINAMLRRQYYRELKSIFGDMDINSFYPIDIIDREKTQLKYDN